MAERSDDPYGDNGVSAAEEEELRKLMQSDDLPPEDNQEGASTDDDPYDDDKGGEPDQVDDAGEEEQQTDSDGDGDTGEDEWRSFLAKHKDKSPEDLAKLAFQQQKRANREAYDSRQSTERLNAMLDRIQQARDARLQEVANRRSDFDKKVQDDPDAALREAHAERLAEEERSINEAAEREAFSVRARQAAEIAAQAIPNFHEEAPKIGRWAQDEMGFSSEEIGSIVDPRMIVTLHLARMAGNMMRAGILTPQGKFANLPTAVKEGDGDKGGNTQRRTQFSRQPARGSQVAKSVEQRMADVANMSDADFDKLSDAELEALLSQEGMA